MEQVVQHLVGNTVDVELDHKEVEATVKEAVKEAVREVVEEVVEQKQPGKAT